MVPRAMARQRPWESLRKMANTKAGTCPQVNVPTVVSHSPHRSEPLPMQPEPNTFRSLLGRSGLYALELPALRPVSEPWRRHLFRRPYGAENKLGRAAGREGVCRTVETQGAAVSIK